MLPVGVQDVILFSSQLANAHLMCLYSVLNHLRSVRVSITEAFLHARALEQMDRESQDCRSLYQCRRLVLSPFDFLLVLARLVKV